MAREATDSRALLQLGTAPPPGKQAILKPAHLPQGRHAHPAAGRRNFLAEPHISQREPFKQKKAVAIYCRAFGETAPPQKANQSKPPELASLYGSFLSLYYKLTYATFAKMFHKMNQITSNFKENN